jgi:hypothetical protein
MTTYFERASVISDVESVFDALECCCAARNYRHGGGIVGYYRAHTCLEGFICQTHLDVVNSSVLPSLKRLGRVRCNYCGRLFTAEEFSTVSPL